MSETKAICVVNTGAHVLAVNVDFVANQVNQRRSTGFISFQFLLRNRLDGNSSFHSRLSEVCAYTAVVCLGNTSEPSSTKHLTDLEVSWSPWRSMALPMLHRAVPQTMRVNRRADMKHPLSLVGFVAHRFGKVCATDVAMRPPQWSCQRKCPCSDAHDVYVPLLFYICTYNLACPGALREEQRTAHRFAKKKPSVTMIEARLHSKTKDRASIR